MALVIVRRPGESFTIGDDVEVKIISMFGRQVRIAVTAPKDKQVLRDDAKIKQKKNH